MAIKKMEPNKLLRFRRAVEDFKKLKGTQKNWFIAGFVDGEGSLNISFARQPSRPGGFLINPKFQVYQHKDYEEILWALRDVFGAGRVDTKWGTDVRVLTIENRKTLREKVIPFFRRYFLVTKRNALEIFAEIIARMDRKAHLALPGFLGIIDLAYNMNQNGKARKIPKEQLVEEVKNHFHQSENPQRPNVELRTP